MDNNGISATDLALLTKDNDNAWNSNPFIYLVWMWSLAAFGGGGFGFGNGYGYGNAALQGSLTRAELADGLVTSTIERQIQDLSSDLANDFGQTNIAMLQGFNGVDRSLCYGFNSVNDNIAENRYAQMQANCGINRNIDAIRYENAKNTCDVITANNTNTRDILDAQNNGVQRIIDYLTNDKIETLRTDLAAAQLTINNTEQTQQLVNALRPFPTPAYITASPYVSGSSVNYAYNV